ncbi:MAG: WG repeat-containing protein [Clostridia bacterium]|nr:WG repeat-containing protein [Clostridia bacterium]
MKKMLASILCCMLLILTMSAPALAGSMLDFRYADSVAAFTEEGLARFQAPNGLYGYVNTKGEIAIDAVFQSASDFSEGLASVSNGSLRGFIDTTGALVLDYQWKYTSNFSEGLAAVQNADFKWGYIDKTGTLVIDYQFSTSGDFENGVAYIGKDSYIDTAGNAVTPEYPSAALFTIEDISTAYQSKFRVSCNGMPVGEYILDYGSFSHKNIVAVEGSESLWRIEYDGYRGNYDLYDAASNRLLMTGMTNIDPVCSEGLIFVHTSAHAYYADETGSMAIPPLSTSAYAFKEGFALNYLNDHCFFINTEGTIMSPMYERATEFCGGFATVKLNGMWHVIDTTFSLLN